METITIILTLGLATLSGGLYFALRQITESLTDIVKKSKETETDMTRLLNETFQKTLKDIETSGKESVREISETAREMVKTITEKPTDDLKTVTDSFMKALMEENKKSYEMATLMLDAVMAKSAQEFSDFRLRRDQMKEQAEILKANPDPDFIQEPPKANPNPLNVSDKDDIFNS